MSDATLITILDQVQNGEKPEYDDIYYALRMMESLHSFRHLDLFRALDRPEKTFEDLYEQAFYREKRAYHTTPKQWLGTK